MVSTFASFKSRYQYWYLLLPLYILFDSETILLQTRKVRERRSNERFMEKIIRDTIAENGQREAKRARTAKAQEDCNRLTLMVPQGAQDPQFDAQLQDAVRAANEEMAREAQREKDKIRREYKVCKDVFFLCRANVEH